MATSVVPVPISGASHLKTQDLAFLKHSSSVKMPGNAVNRKLNPLASNRKLSICAEYNNGGRGGGADFVAGFLLGGAVFGTLAYIFAPQIRRSLLNEDEYGFRRASRPIYYDDEGLEVIKALLALCYFGYLAYGVGSNVFLVLEKQKTRQTLNAKLSQLNAAIDKVSSRLRGRNNAPSVPVETDPEVEATM
ncbi:hypothetical protein Ancab_009432 [Ancistrocladus abbreviatus]